MVTLLYSPFMPLCPIEYILSYTKKVSIFQKVGGKIFLERKAGGRKSLNLKCAQIALKHFCDEALLISSCLTHLVIDRLCSIDLPYSKSVQYCFITSQNCPALNTHLFPPILPAPVFLRLNISLSILRDMSFSYFVSYTFFCSNTFSF